MNRKPQIAFIILWFLCLLNPFHALAAEGNLARAAETLVEQLNEQVKLSFLQIQVAPDNFKDPAGTMHPGFAKIIELAISSTLVRQGALISVHEQGKTPLKLVGTYRKSGDRVEIHVRLRLMEMAGSRDLALAQVEVKEKGIGLAWFTVGIEQVAVTLLQQIEEQYAGVAASLTVTRPEPGIAGQPTLKLGNALKKNLEQAAVQSEIFGGYSFGVNRPAYTLASTYALVGHNVEFTVRLMNKAGKPLSSASAILPQEKIPSELLAMTDDRGKFVCVEYLPRSRADVKAGSLASERLSGLLSSSLAEYGINAGICLPEYKQYTRIQASLRLDKRSTRDGFGILTGSVVLTVLDPAGRITGSFSEKATSTYTGQAGRAAEMVMEKIFTREFKEKTAEYLLGK